MTTPPVITPNADRAALTWLAAGILLFLGVLAGLRAWVEPQLGPALVRWVFVLTTSTPTIATIWLGAAGLGWPVRRYLLRNPTCPVALQFASGLAILLWVSWLLAWAGLLNHYSSWALCIGSAAILLIPMYQIQRRDGAVYVALPPIPWAFMAAVPTLGIMTVACCCPPGTVWSIEAYGYDVLSYHLQLPREWIETGHMSGLQHNVYSFFPSLAEVSYMLIGEMAGTMYQGIYQAQLFHLSIGVLAAFCIGGIAAVPGGRTAGGIAAAAFIVMPWTMVTGTEAYDEMFALSFGAAAILLAIDPACLNTRSAALAGFLAGVATLGKLTAGPNLAFPAGVILLLGLRHSVFARNLWMSSSSSSTTGAGKSSISSILQSATGYFNTTNIDKLSEFYVSCLRLSLVAGVTGVLTLLPYLIRNKVETGNPVFPFAARSFGSGHWSTDDVTRFTEAHSGSGDAAERFDALKRQWLFNTGYGALGGTTYIRTGAIEAHNIAHFNREFGFPLFLILAGVAAVVTVFSKRLGNVGTALLFTLVFQIAFWLLTTHLQSRFMIFSLVPLCALFGLGVARALETKLLWLQTSAIVLAIGTILITAQTGMITFWQQTLGNPDTNEHFRPGQIMDTLPTLNQLRENKAGLFLFGDHTVNQIPDGSRVMLVADAARLLYIRVPMVYASAFDPAPIGDAIRAAGSTAATSQSLASVLRQAHVTHLWVHWSELERLRETYGFDRDVIPEKLHSILRDWPVEFDSPGVVTFYRVPE